MEVKAMSIRIDLRYLTDNTIWTPCMQTTPPQGERRPRRQTRESKTNTDRDNDSQGAKPQSSTLCAECAAVCCFSTTRTGRTAGLWELETFRATKIHTVAHRRQILSITKHSTKQESGCKLFFFSQGYLNVVRTGNLIGEVITCVSCAHKELKSFLRFESNKGCCVI